jgi:hypothetical protein
MALTSATPAAPRRNVLVTGLEEGAVRLRALDPQASRLLSSDGVFALTWDGGRARLGSNLSGAGGVWRRTIEPGADGLPPPGAVATVDPLVFAGDPLSAHGLAFDEVSIATPAGNSPAWQVPGSGRTWAVVVHGKGADRTEALRILPTLSSAGVHTLVVTYANDAGAPPGPRGHHGYGAHEWRDLEAAVTHALAGGAERVVLVGFSMGAAITLAFLRNSPQRDAIRGLIFEAPVLSLAATVEHYAVERGIPSPVVAVGRRVAGWRFGVDWEATAYVDVLTGLDIPLLLFHGDRDTVVPVRFSDELAESRPAIEYARVEGAMHMCCWNADPARYEQRVAVFLAGLA